MRPLAAKADQGPIEPVNPAISLVIATYKRPHLIERALDSVLAQSLRPNEVIVVDDASGDNTGDVVAAWSARTSLPVQFIAAERNSGVGAARNIAMRRASSEFIAFLDSDDAWLPHALETLVAPLLAHAEPVLSFADGRQVWPDGRSQVRMMGRCLDEARDTVPLDPARPSWRMLSNPQDKLLTTSMIPTCAALFRRSAAEAVGLMPEYRHGEDWIFWLKLTDQGPFVCQFTDLASIYRQDDNLTGPEHSVFISRQTVSTLLRLRAGHYGIAITPQNMRRLDVEIARRLAAMRYWHSLDGLSTYLQMLRSHQVAATGGALYHMLRDPRSLLRAAMRSVRPGKA